MSEFRTVQRRVMNMVARGVVAETDDEPGMQRVQVSLLHQEGKTAVERLQNYGFSANAPRQSEVLVVFVGGGRDHGVIVGTDDRSSRFTGLAEGEAAIYTDEGDSIVLRRDNTIEITTRKLHAKVSPDEEGELIVEAGHVTFKSAETLTLEAPDIRLKGRVVIDGALSQAEGGEATTFNLKGNLHVDGNIDATGSINAPGGGVGGN